MQWIFVQYDDDATLSAAMPIALANLASAAFAATLLLSHAAHAERLQGGIDIEVFAAGLHLL